jgi:chorismate mutase
MKNWLAEYGELPLLIAGPCSAETYEQLKETALAVTKLSIPLVRAGVWKPRTRPGSFEGIGAEALQWMDRIREEHPHIKFAIEVGHPQHVELALRHQVEVVWIGARSTVNPFNVQEIAEALAGTQQPVLVKNPINPDLALWLGALERLEKQGISKIGAIHRGFSSFGESRYRNQPDWQLPIELKRERPDLPLLCDPSHIAGDRNIIFDISQKALDLDYDGLMIETHPRPDEAWSDAKQQVTPESLAEILRNLRYPESTTLHSHEIDALANYRELIDQADQEILEALNRRMRLVDKIGEYKKANNLTILDLERWEYIFRTRPELGKQLGLKKSFVKKLYQFIHEESIKRQNRIKREG